MNKTPLDQFSESTTDPARVQWHIPNSLRHTRYCHRHRPSSIWWHCHTRVMKHVKKFQQIID